MPVIRGKDDKGLYFKYGSKGHKYYYIKNDKESRTKAQNKAKKQGRAIEWSKHTN